MNWNERKAHFRETDDDVFIRAVSDYVEARAPELHELTTQEYVERCRCLWEACQTDQVFKFKLLVDKLVREPWAQELSPPPGLRDVSESTQPAEDLYVTAVGLRGADGSFVDAPNGYDPSASPRPHRSFIVMLPAPAPIEEPEDPTPAPYVLAMFDLLGFSNKLEELGLTGMHDCYRSLIAVALRPYAEQNQWTRVLVRYSDDLAWPGVFQLPIRYAYFSDTIILWIPCEPLLIRPFLHRVLSMFCEALRLGLPLRGAVASGTAILHKRSNTFLGKPLITAAKLEVSQQWMGAAYGVQIGSEGSDGPFNPRQVILYDAPVKKHDKQPPWVPSGLVLDWPRRWREMHGVSATDAVRKLRPPDSEVKAQVYYDHTLRFIEYSDAHPEWLRERIGRTPEQRP